MSNTKELSPFGQHAVALDRDFSELERLSGQLERTDLESDSGLEYAVKLLNHFSECGTRVAEGVQAMAKALEESRSRAETAAKSVAAKALLVQGRHELSQKLLVKFHSLSEQVREVTASVAEFKDPGFDSDALDGRLAGLIGQAGELRDEARGFQMKNLEKNAHALAQSLASARQRLGTIASSFRKH